VSAAVDSCAYLWHRGGEVVAVYRPLASGGALLLEVKGDDGQRVEVTLPEREIVELARVLVDHVRDYGLGLVGDLEPDDDDDDDDDE
jgi:hypothetical protein